MVQLSVGPVEGLVSQNYHGIKICQRCPVGWSMPVFVTKVPVKIFSTHAVIAEVEKWANPGSFKAAQVGNCGGVVARRSACRGASRRDRPLK